jgi:hydroxyacylglutathione hydrolase
MQIETFTLGELQTNSYLLTQESSSEALLIDPADGSDWLNEELLRRGLQLKAVLLTHGHFDHVLALLGLKLAWQMPILLHPADNFLLERAAASAEHWLKHSVDPVPAADQEIEDQEQLSIAGFSFQVIALPGHTPGSVGFLFPKEKMFFSGDTLFQDGVGSTQHHYSNKTALFKSLQKIKTLSEAQKIAEIYPGHGESFFPNF